MQFTIMSVDWGPYKCEMYNSNECNNNNLGNVDICGRPSILTIDMREWRRRRKCDSESVSDINSIKTKNCHRNWQLNNNILQSRILSNNNNNMNCLPNRTEVTECHSYSKLSTFHGSPPPKLLRPGRKGGSRHNSSSVFMCVCVMILLLCCGVSAQLRPDTDIISHRQSDEGGE
jgi:hypothetical protein